VKTRRKPRSEQYSTKKQKKYEATLDATIPHGLYYERCFLASKHEKGGRNMLNTTMKLTAIAQNGLVLSAWAPLPRPFILLKSMF